MKVETDIICLIERDNIRQLCHILCHKQTSDMFILSVIQFLSHLKELEMKTTSFLDYLKLKYIYFFILHLNRYYVLFVFHRSFNKLFRNCLFQKHNLGACRWMSSDFLIRPKEKKNVFLVSRQNLIFTTNPNIFIDAKRLYPKPWKFPDRKHALSDLILILHQLF